MASKGPAYSILDRSVVFAAAVVMTAAVGCGSEESESTTTTAPLDTAATTTTSVTTAASSPEVILPEPGEPWDLLFLAYEYLMGDVIPEMYAERAEQELGVDINLHSALGFETDAWLLRGHIGGGRYPDLSDPIRQAEIIVMQVRPLKSNEGNKTAIDADSANCGRFISTTDPKPPRPTTTGYWQPYRELLDAIYKEIWRLREGLPTVLIATDIQDTYLAKQREAGIESECRVWREAWSRVEADAAVDHAAAMVSIYDILNGPAHDVDPVEMGYLGPTEEYPSLAWTTPNEVAAEMVVEALAAAGFEPWPMP